MVPNGFVSLKDAQGNIGMMVAADQPPAWGQYFGIEAEFTSGKVNISVVYAPPGGAAGVGSTVTLEKFPDVSFNPTDANYVAAQINALSKFIRVPSSYNPPAVAPNSFPSAPAMLLNSGVTTVLDAQAAPYLEVQPLSPSAWPANFGVLAQGDQLNPTHFNLLLLYNPPSGGVGVQIPIVIEQFPDLSLATVTEAFSSGSNLVTVRSFDQQPSPSLSAYELTHVDARKALPAIKLTGVYDNVTTTWTPQLNLLGAGATDPLFVVEIESNGVARLRFGDNINGLTPPAGTLFTAAYRIGNGAGGNIGADSLTFVAGDPRIVAVTNPLPAAGGTDPETNDQIRRRAPQAFNIQERAVNMADYARAAELDSQVDQAVATLRWTGSWYTVFIAAEPQGAGNLTSPLLKAIAKNVDLYRLAGQDFQLESPQYVPLKIELTVCVDPAYFSANVEKALLQVLGSQPMPNGQKGLFYPDNFTFGQTVYLSRIYAAARSVAGVQSVVATVFQPEGPPNSSYIASGEIPVGPFEIARMQNDPSLPDHGRLTLAMLGGK